MEVSTYIVGSFVAHLAALAVMATSLPEMETSDDVIDDEQRFGTYQVFVAAEQSGLPLEGEDACGGCDTAMGDSDATTTGARYGVEGPSDNPDPHLSRYDDGDDFYLNPSLNGSPMLAAIGTQAPVAPWGFDSALGTDPVGGRGAMWGEEIGDSFGDDGLGFPRSASADESTYGYRCRMP